MPCLDEEWANSGAVYESHLVTATHNSESKVMNQNSPPASPAQRSKQALGNRARNAKLHIYHNSSNNASVPVTCVQEGSQNLRDTASTFNGQATPLVALTRQEVDDVVADVTELMQRELTKVLGNVDAASQAIERGRELFLYNIEDSRFFSTASVERRLRHLIRKAAGLEPKRRPRRNKRRAGDESKTEHGIGDGIFTFEELTEQIADPRNFKKFEHHARKYVGPANDAEIEDITASALELATAKARRREVSFNNIPQYCTWLYEVVRRLALARHRSLRVELAELTANRDAEGVEIDFGAIVGQDCETEIVKLNEHIQNRQTVREVVGQLQKVHQKSLQDEIHRREIGDKSAKNSTVRVKIFRARESAKQEFSKHNVYDAAFIPANDNYWPIDDDE